jgi:hypothetical protein
MNSASYQAGHKQANNDNVQQWCAELHLVSPGHRWAIAADDHTGFNPSQLIRSGSSEHAITNTGQLKSGKTLPGPAKSGSCHVMLLEESGFGANGMSLWPQPAWCRRWCNGVGNVLLAHVRSLDTN